MEHKRCLVCKKQIGIDNFTILNPRNIISREYDNICKKCKKKEDKKFINLTVSNNRSKASCKSYNISKEEFNVLFNLQGGRCKICNIHQSELKKALCIDHCHETRFVRGLLCSNCNNAIGLFKEKIESLESAIKYLIQSKS